MDSDAIMAADPFDLCSQERTTRGTVIFRMPDGEVVAEVLPRNAEFLTGARMALCEELTSAAQLEDLRRENGVLEEKIEVGDRLHEKELADLTAKARPYREALEKALGVMQADPWQDRSPLVKEIHDLLAGGVTL